MKDFLEALEVDLDEYRKKYQREWEEMQGERIKWNDKEGKLDGYERGDLSFLSKQGYVQVLRMICSHFKLL